MISVIHQGEVLELEAGKQRILVVSRDFFNQTGLCVVCPVTAAEEEDPLHIRVTFGNTEGTVLCEHLKTMDLKKRHYRTCGTLELCQIQDVSDAVQAIFDYYPYG